MGNNIGLTEAGRQYVTAYTVHYIERDLHGAFQLYLKIMKSYPGEQEARYCRTQMQNILNGVEPKQELLDSQGGTSSYLKY